MSDETWIDPRRIAAVVYDDGVAVDSLLSVFAADLVAHGARLGGIIQLPRSEPGCGPNALRQLRDLETGELVPLCRAVVRQAGKSCALDPESIQRAAQRIRTATLGGADILFLSRFGRLEAAGRGFSEALCLAVQRGGPVLTAVRRGLTDNWLSATGGIGTLLDARLWVLRDWWNELGVCPLGRVARVV
jgi:molybdate transport system ATP-binding protein